MCTFHDGETLNVFVNGGNAVSDLNSKSDLHLFKCEQGGE